MGFESHCRTSRRSVATCATRCGHWKSWNFGRYSWFLFGCMHTIHYTRTYCLPCEASSSASWSKIWVWCDPSFQKSLCFSLQTSILNLWYFHMDWFGSIFCHSQSFSLDDVILTFQLYGWILLVPATCDSMLPFSLNSHRLENLRSQTMQCTEEGLTFMERIWIWLE